MGTTRVARGGYGWVVVSFVAAVLVSAFFTLAPGPGAMSQGAGVEVPSTAPESRSAVTSWEARSGGRSNLERRGWAFVSVLFGPPVVAAAVPLFSRRRRFAYWSRRISAGVLFAWALILGLYIVPLLYLAAAVPMLMAARSVPNSRYADART